MNNLNKTEKYCNNCGLKGHLYKECLNHDEILGILFLIKITIRY